MVAKRKAKDLPEARRNNPYAELSREELDVALSTTRTRLATSDDDERELARLKAEERQILDAFIWRMVDEGHAFWSGEKPKLPKKRIKLTPGPPISDYIIADRDLLRS